MASSFAASAAFVCRCRISCSFGSSQSRAATRSPFVFRRASAASSAAPNSRQNTSHCVSVTTPTNSRSPSFVLKMSYTPQAGFFVAIGGYSRSTGNNPAASSNFPASTSACICCASPVTSGGSSPVMASCAMCCATRNAVFSYSALRTSVPLPVFSRSRSAARMPMAANMPPMMSLTEDPTRKGRSGRPVM